MKNMRRLLSVLMLAVPFILAATPAQAHSGMEALGVFIVGMFVLVGILGGIIIHFFGKYAGRKLGIQPTAKRRNLMTLVVIAATLAMLAFGNWNARDLALKEQGFKVFQLQGSARQTYAPPADKIPPVTADAAERAKVLLEKPNKNPSDMFELGSMYRRGDGVSQDFAEAYFWLSLATRGFGMSDPDGPAAEAARIDSRKRLTSEQVASVHQRIIDWGAKRQTP